MIQRIQTIYLLLIAVCGILLCCIPPFVLTTAADAAEQAFIPVAFGDYWAIYVLSAAFAVMALVIIFLFKNRILQVRLCFFNFGLMLGYYALLAMYLWFAKQHGLDWYLNWSASLPLVGIVLGFMAIRRISADEALVRAADRLR